MKSKTSFLFLLFLIAIFNARAQFYTDQSTNLPDNGAKGQSMDVQAADLDDDSDLDIILANEFQGNTILLNDGNGNFTNASATNLPQVIHDSEDIAIADFDQDGDPDLVFCSEDDFIHEFYLNDGNGVFTSAAFQLPNSVSNAVLTSDFNDDGIPDLLFGNAGQNVLLINNGDGSFVDETADRLPSNSNTTQDLALADIDNDGDSDLFIGNEDGNKILINNSEGVFSDESDTRLPQGLNIETRKATFGDVDADGDVDLFLSNVMFIPGKNRQNRLFINDGNGHFTDETDTRLPTDGDDTLDGIFLDIDLDGDLDLFVANVMLQTITSQKVYLNDGNGNFTNASEDVLPSNYALNALGVIAADLNGDNLEDLYICDRNTGSGLKDVLLIRNFVNNATNLDLTPDQVKLYPNPVNEYFFVELKFEAGDSLSFQLMDNSGKTIADLQPEKYAHQWYKINLAPFKDSLNTGTYFLHIRSDKKRYSAKIFLE